MAKHGKRKRRHGRLRVNQIEALLFALIEIVALLALALLILALRGDGPV